MLDFRETITPAEQFSLESLLNKEKLSLDGSSVQVLTGDGSDRRFIRVSGEGSVIIILPSANSAQGMDEARSSWLIGRHLRQCGVPVPEMKAYDPQTGTILCEDLGDILLHHHLVDCRESEIGELYRHAIDILINMQIRGGESFVRDMSWEGAVYDRRTMLDRESGYFFTSCCSKLLGLSDPPPGLDNEFSALAACAGRQPPCYFLHRDFQSRNIMVQGERLRVIDFQGGRLGPLGYDLASLLIDPYVCLPKHLKLELLEYYLEETMWLTGAARDDFIEGYSMLAIQRNLQILGAYAFLSLERGKEKFSKYLYPASLSLLELVGVQRDRFPILYGVVGDLCDTLHSGGGSCS